MTESTVPEFFRTFPMHRVRAAELDEVLADGHAGLDLLFLWGHDCPNCDVAKRAILNSTDRFRWSSVRWLHGNVY